MTKHDTPLLHPQDLPAAVGLLSRIPIRVDGELALQRGARAAWAWPLVGLVIGAFTGALALGLIWAGLPIPMAALIALTSQVMITGAMHEDGLADCADGFWGGYERKRRLEIMKDSRIGAYGVIAICLSLAARLLALIFLLAAPCTIVTLMAVGMISRLPMVVLMNVLSNAREDGLAQSVGRPPMATLWIAVALTLGLGILLLGSAAVPVLLIVSAITLAWALIARRKIGGQTGDVLGANQQIAEITALFTLTSLLT